MRDHLATLLDDFRRFDREVAVVRYQGNRRRVTTYGELARLAGRLREGDWCVFDNTAAYHALGNALRLRDLTKG